MDLGGAEEIADLEEAPGASQDADRLRRADQRGFFLHRAIFFSTEEERGGIAALAGQRNADRVCDRNIFPHASATPAKHRRRGDSAWAAQRQQIRANPQKSAVRAHRRSRRPNPRLFSSATSH